MLELKNVTKTFFAGTANEKEGAARRLVHARGR